jgi:DnaK suppressor protein
MAHQSNSTKNHRATLLAIRAELLASPRLRPEDLDAHEIPEEDQAKMSHDQFVSLRLNHFDYMKLRYVTEALQRISDGDYGLCAECGEAISNRRLQAIPWAKYCVTCEELRDRNHQEQMTQADLSHAL